MNICKIFIQIFTIDYLLINISKHVLVPKLRILSQDETIKIKNHYNIEKMNQFPIILKTNSLIVFFSTSLKNDSPCF